MTEELQLTKQDLEAHVAFLKNETIEISTSISLSLRELENAKAEVVVAKAEKAKIYVDIDKERSELKEEYVRIDVQKKELADLKETTNIELVNLKANIKGANKDLGWVNDKVLKADDEYHELEQKRNTILREIEEKTALRDKIIATKEELESFEEKRDKVKSQISEMIDASTLDLKLAQEELKTISRLVEEKNQEKNQAEYMLKKYTDELHSHMNDWYTIKSRLESVWNKTFPELELPLTI